MSASLPLAPMGGTTPIACALGAGEFAGRIALISALNQAALRSHSREHYSLLLQYAPSASADVRALVAQERECCAFLHFHVDETPTAVHLRIDAPAGVEDAESLFAPFLAGVDEPQERSITSDTGFAGGSDTRARSPGVAAGTAAVAALACGVCCVLPFALPAVALAGFGGIVAALAQIFWWALGVAVIAVVAAWSWVIWRSVKTGRRPAAATLRAMIAATALLVAAAGWPYLEPAVRRALKS
jgi:hypothetical protein